MPSKKKRENVLSVFTIVFPRTNVHQRGDGATGIVNNISRDECVIVNLIIIMRRKFSQ